MDSSGVPGNFIISVIISWGMISSFLIRYRNKLNPWIALKIVLIGGFASILCYWMSLVIFTIFFSLLDDPESLMWMNPICTNIGIFFILWGYFRYEINDSLENHINLLVSNGVENIESVSKDKVSELFDWAENMVLKYGELMESQNETISNEKRLPCAKEKMKLAIKVTIIYDIMTKEKRRIEGLSFAYNNLSSFQNISDKDFCKINKFSQIKGEIDLDELNRNSDKVSDSDKEIVRKKLLEGRVWLKAHSKYSERICEESNILAREMSEFTERGMPIVIEKLVEIYQ